MFFQWHFSLSYIKVFPVRFQCRLARTMFFQWHLSVGRIQVSPVQFLCSLASADFFQWHSSVGCIQQSFSSAVLVQAGDIDCDPVAFQSALEHPV